MMQFTVLEPVWDWVHFIPLAVFIDDEHKMGRDILIKFLWTFLLLSISNKFTRIGSVYISLEETVLSSTISDHADTIPRYHLVTYCFVSTVDTLVTVRHNINNLHIY